MKENFKSAIPALLLVGIFGLFSVSLVTKGQEARDPTGQAAAAQTPTPLPTPTPSPSPGPTGTPTPVPEPEPAPTASPTPALRS